MSKTDLIQSYKFALKGIAVGFHKEQNIKILLVFGSIATFLCIILNVSLIKTLIVFILSTLVIILELINTAIEKLCDRITSKNDSEIAKIKDICAGIVLISALLDLIVGLIIISEPLIELIL